MQGYKHIFPYMSLKLGIWWQITTVMHVGEAILHQFIGIFLFLLLRGICQPFTMKFIIPSFHVKKKSIPVFQEAKILFPLAFLSCSLFLEARKSFNSKDENHCDKSAWYKKRLKIPNQKQ